VERGIGQTEQEAEYFCAGPGGYELREDVHGVCLYHTVVCSCHTFLHAALGP
jgi:hypothetical protein